jgi:hypothetical protein
MEFNIVPMLPCFSIVRLFLGGGGLLVILGFVLWLALPIQSTFPPFLPTALLALIYGLICLKQCRNLGGGKK